MTSSFRFLATSAAAACALSLTACAVSEQQAGSAAKAENSIAGTRLPVATTDRMVKQIGNAGAREMARDKPPNPGSAAN
jgi:hypothetical protein